MGGKKKGGDKPKKAAASNEEDERFVENFWGAYRKEVQKYEDLTVCDQIKSMIDEALEEGEKVTKFHIHKELGWEGTRAIMDALRNTAYPYCISLRFWNAYCFDEGVRSICQYVDGAKNVQLLELLHNRITPLGCEFISKSLHPKMDPKIEILKLDHNEFGSAGMIRLADGLAINSVLRTLSVTYCNIDQDAAQAIFEILIYTKSHLEEFNLSGNLLRSEGVKKVFAGVSIAKALKKIYLADNQWSADDEGVMEMIEGCMGKNQNLGRYDFRYNMITTDALSKLTEILKGDAQHVFEINIPERIEDKEVFKNFMEALGSNKPKKGKKGGKGGKKAGKKKKK